ncbi:MAG: autotransporter assembly complex protein TamA [Methylococcaceae bacterium]
MLPHKCGRWATLFSLGLLVLPLVRADDNVSVSIEGLTEMQAKNVRAMLTMARISAHASKEAVELAEDRAAGEISRALETFGYYRPVITAATVDHDSKGWHAAFRIDPGPAMPVAKVEVSLAGEATDEADMRRLAEQFPLKVGHTLDHALYEKGREALQQEAAELGFFDARFLQRELRVDIQTYTAEVHIRLDSGKRYLFGEVSFAETTLNQELLKGFTRFETGTPYRASSVLATQKSLLNSGYFAKADVIPRPEKARDGRVPIDVDLTMVPRNRVDLGGGYGTDTGPRLSFGYRNRYINRYGHTFQASAKLSLIWNQIDAMYAIPLADPERDQLAFTTKLGLEDTVAGRAKVARAGVRHSTTRWDLREALSLDFLRENFTIGGVNQTTDLLIPSVNYTWLDSDDAIFPSEGIRIDTNLAGAVRGFASEASFIRLRIYGKGVYSLNPDNRLIARAQLGEMVTNDFDRMPITERFYAGGAPTVRGYRLNEISPYNAQGERIGGRHLAVASVEYDRALFDDWGIAAFSDFGYVTNDFNEPVKTGVGLGARWRSPVGPVRLDVGVPLGKALDPVQVYLILGPDL